MEGRVKVYVFCAYNALRLENTFYSYYDCLVGIVSFLSWTCILQDALFKGHATLDTESRLQACSEILTKSHITLNKFRCNPVISIAYLEAVAETRFAMMEIANFIHSQFSDEGRMRLDRSMEESATVTTLMELAKSVCTDTVINTTTFSSRSWDVVGPAVYLLKLLMRQFSFSCLKQASEKYLWIVPDGLRNSNLVIVMI